MIKAIFFDFDGVIVESFDIKTNAFARLFAHEGGDVVRRIVDYHLNNGGISRFEKFRYIYNEILKRPLDDVEFQELCNKFANYVLESVITAPYVKGAIEFLQNHASEYKCFVVSGTPQKEIEEIIQRRDIRKFFRGIYGAPIKKSDAVRDILVKEEIESINAVYIGDAMNDYIAANDNSVRFIARINNNEFIFCDVDCLKVRDLMSLITIISTLNSCLEKF